MSTTPEKKKPRIVLFGTLALLIPLILVGIGFFAVKSDAENKRKYDQLRKEQAERIAQLEASRAIQNAEK